MQKYRADYAVEREDGSVLWFADWMGGPSLAKIANCRLDLAGDMRRTVYITGKPDTAFSQPAICKIAGCCVKGFISNDKSGCLVFYANCYD